MGATDGDPVRGSRAARKVADPTLHTDETENDSFTLHLDPTAAEGEAMVMGGAGAYVATDVLTPTEHTAIGDNAPHHAAVTLGEGNNAALSLEGQELTLGPTVIPLVDADPASPIDGEAWVRKTATAVGTPIGMLLMLTHTLYTRELSVYDGGAVYRTTLTVGV